MESAQAANDRFAAIYDEWNSQNDYEMWLGEILLPELEKHGLRKGWALDVGCGTGRAFDPLLARGWQVVGCDVAPQMLAEARRKFGSRVQLVQADARALPPIRPAPELPEEEAFQLILLLNDVVNYLTEDSDLERLFLAIKRNLSPAGLAVFDANTLAQFRGDYPSDVRREIGDWQWRGLMERVEPEAVYEGEVSGHGVTPHIHRQRHWTIEQMREGLKASNLHCLSALGQREEDGRVLLSATPNEERDAKVVYIVGHAA